jgi:uncharacterized protein (TIGR01777 family)
MKILITGASGLVGKALGQELKRAGHTVCRLVRPGTVDTGTDSGGFDVKWDPATRELGGAAVGADAVVNLAGAPVADKRWSDDRKKLLRSSRVDSTRALVGSLERMAARPGVLVSASAVGYYGDRGDEILTEESGPSKDFLGELAREWEEEARQAEALNIRVVRARFGIILAKHGGALPQMMKPFRFGLGGKLGTGQQWMSWVTVADAVAILKYALENNGVRGAVNVVSPQPVRNAEFTKVLGKIMHRPAFFAAPAFALRLALGEMADGMLLASERVQPAVLEKLGYRFLHPDLAIALKSILA